MNEFVIEWIKGKSIAGVTVPSGSALKSKLLKMAVDNSDDVKIIAVNEDGSVYAHIPVKYIKISPPRRISEKQKKIASERFKQMWSEKQKKNGENEDVGQDIK